MNLLRLQVTTGAGLEAEATTTPGWAACGKLPASNLLTACFSHPRPEPDAYIC